MLALLAFLSSSSSLQLEKVKASIASLWQVYNFASGMDADMIPSTALSLPLVPPAGSQAEDFIVSIAYTTKGLFDILAKGLECRHVVVDYLAPHFPNFTIAKGV